MFTLKVGEYLDNLGEIGPYLHWQKCHHNATRYREVAARYPRKKTG